eukprot:gene10645-3269_t
MVEPNQMKIFPFASRDFLKKNNILPKAIKKKYNNSFLEKITISTQLTPERLSRLEEISNFWNYKISAVLYILLYDHDLSEIDTNEYLQKIYEQHPQILHTVDIHLVFGKTVSKEYPLNTLRNIAWNYVDTEFIFLLDVDFIPSTNFDLTFKHLKPNFLKKLSNSKSLFVVPAFHFNCSDVTNIRTCEVSEPILPLHPSHNATDIEKWKNSTEPFKIKYRFLYEPYVIANTNITRYNELFDIGNDKVSHFYELAAQKYEFFILPYVYIAHLPHTESVKWSLESNIYDPLRAWFKLAKFMREIAKKYDYNYFCTMTISEEDEAQIPHVMRRVRRVCNSLCENACSDNFTLKP